MDQVAIDRRALTEDAYPDSRNLHARASIYEFKDPADDWWSFVLDQVDWPGGARVLDVGCGPGTYLERLAARDGSMRLAGLDLSAGMAAEASRHAPAVVGDVCALPVRTASVDRLLAPHMLYHAPDMDDGAAELRRVLAPGGVALVVTNSREHLRHLVELLARAAGIDAPVRVIDRFTLEDGGALLACHFDEVRVEHLRGLLVVPFAEPVVRYADSTRALYESQLPPSVTWSDAMAAFARLVEDEVARTGAWRDTTHSGVFVCR